MVNIFVSYTSTDREWAFWLAKEVEALGHAPHVHEFEIKPGEDIYAWMVTHHDAADHVLCVVSDEYLKAPYSTLERNAALWQAASKRPGFVLFVVVKPCRLPTLSDHIRRCELFGVPEAAARVRFREFMSRRETPEAAAFPGKVFAVSNIPIRVPKHFLGRDDALAAIEATLASDRGRVAITALYGLRGVGKTVLAAAYAERHRAEYRATWWIRAQTESTMRADLVGLGVRLGWTAADEKEDPALSTVLERLQHEGEGVLLIYDNALDADALRPYLPRGGRAQALVTSNAHAWRGVATPVELQVWLAETGADYLVARTGRAGESEAALALSNAMGGLPLAHEQAAAYCEWLDISLAEYRKRFEAAPARLLDDARHASVDYHDGLTVAKTFELAIEEAAKLHQAAEPLIAHAALLAAEPIPLFVFAEAREKFGEPLASTLEGEGLDEAVAALLSFALVDRESIADERQTTIATDCIRLHRLVRQVAAARCDGEAREKARRVLVDAAVAVYPAEVFNDPRTWPRARRLDTLALALVGDDAALPQHAHESVAYLLDLIAGYRRHALAAYTHARPLFERALAIREKVLGSEHPDTATSLNNLAQLLREQGDLAEARRVCERALAIREKVLGPGHPDTAASLTELAFVLHAQGNLAGARPVAERALAIHEKVLGPEHPDTAATLNTLAQLLHAQGDLAGARPLFERALAIYKKVLGSEHPETATSLNSLAQLLLTQGDLAGARPLFERALAIREKVLGPEHPDTATTLNDLAFALRAQGNLVEARPLFERALAIYTKVLGSEHPDTATSLDNLALLLREQGDLAEARRVCERALAIREKVLGPEHPDTAASLNKLAELLHAKGDLASGLALYERALAIAEKVLGCDHPNTNRSRYNIATVLLASGKANEALTLGMAALAAHDKALGQNHVWTKASARVTADALDALGRLEEAKAVRRKYGVEKRE